MALHYIWTPHITSTESKKLEFILTSGDDDTVSDDKDFVRGLLNDMGFDFNIESWSMKPYRSNYYSEYLDSADWRDIWQIIWKFSVISAQKIEEIPKRQTLWTGTNATGLTWCDRLDDDAKVGCLIVSDFGNEKLLNKAKEEIASNSLEALRNRYSVSSPIFNSFEVFDRYQQLQIDLGQFSGQFFAQGADYAQYVIDLCQQANGTVHFEAHDYEVI